MKKITIEELLLELENTNKRVDLLAAEVVALSQKLEASAPTTRDRGPRSDREMTEEDARQVMMGELKELSHKAAAEKLGLSYGQIYSARGGYTFKKVYKEAEEAKKAEAKTTKK